MEQVSLRQMVTDLVNKGMDLEKVAEISRIPYKQIKQLHKKGTRLTRSNEDLAFRNLKKTWSKVQGDACLIKA